MAGPAHRHSRRISSPPHSRSTRCLRFESLEGRVVLSALVSFDSSPALQAGADGGSTDAAVAPLLAELASQARPGAPTLLHTAALSQVHKLIVAGDPSGLPPDTPADRVDPNTTTSAFAGVGSLAIRLDPYLYICTATAISPTHVLTAAHCLDLDDNGSIDVAPSDVQFDLNFGSNLSHKITGAALFVHPDWTGFDHPSVNDDVAIVELAEPLPPGVPIYPLHADPFTAVETVTMVGYGRSGDGVSGYYVSPSFVVKRVGSNQTDFYDVDDEGSGAREVFEFDFDGNGYDFSSTPGLGNDVETTLGGGDSGGPAFVDDGHGGLEIFGIDTHDFGFLRPIPFFGSGGGGIVVAPYADWIHSIIDSNSEPAAPLLMETGVVAGVGNGGWTTVTLQHTYSSMVVVATPNYDASAQPGVVRIRNASGNRFDLRVDSTNGAAISGVTVHYLVVEEGVYTAAEDGITMEAVKFTSTLTDHKGSWTGQVRSYANSYTHPVVLGQIMSYNDPDYSLFWASGNATTDPPSGAFLRVGKHVGEDPDTTRANETVGYIVVEAGGGTLSDGREFFAAVGADIVRGMDNAPPYVYSPTALAFKPAAAIADLAGLDGADGGWAVLYGANPATSTALKLAVDEDLNDAERSHTTEQVAYLLLGPAPGPTLESGTVAGVTNTGWTTVTLENTYSSMVVVASVNELPGMPPLLTRIQHALGRSFEVRVDRADGSVGTVSGVEVYYFVVQEGVYTAAEHGITMEAVKFTSALTDHKGSWVGQTRPYANSYANPVVLGQVMSYNDPGFSVFWSAGATTDRPPSGSVLRVGKHVGEDPDTTRNAETIGYVVIETGTGAIGGLHYAAGVGADSVTGVGDSPPTLYPFDTLVPSGGAVTQTGMDGNNGGWAVLYGSTPLTSTAIKLAIDEDQLGDLERNHTTEQVAYFVFGTPVSAGGTLPVSAGPGEAAHSTNRVFLIPPSSAPRPAEQPTELPGPIRPLSEATADAPGSVAASAAVHRPAPGNLVLDSHPADQAIMELVSEEMTADLLLDANFPLAID